MTARLDGKTILVTGAASGIGLATARLVGERGGIAVSSDVKPGCDLLLDVTDATHWDGAIAAIVSQHVRIDGLVANAGIAGGGSVLDLDMDEFRNIARVNVQGTFIGIQKVVAQMRRQRRPAQGSIVVTSSIVGNVPIAGTASYGASKAALTNMARALGIELGRKGDFIRVNAVAPGPVETAMFPAGYFDNPDNVADVPLRSASGPEDIAETICFLLSDESSFMTASVNAIDGGWALS